MKKQFKISDQKIVELYLSGLTLKEVAIHAQDNVGVMALRKKLHELGVDTSRQATKARYNERRSKAMRRYTFNEHVFDVIDTEEKAYWLGFLMADGYNHESKTCVALRLQEEDVEVLECLKAFLQYNGVITRYSRITNTNHLHRTYCELSLYSPVFSKSLAEKGCVQGKTYTLQFPEYLPKHLVHHFIRGLFDGDGCISITPRKNRTLDSKSYQFNIVGTEAIMERVKDIFVEQIGVTRTTTKHHSKAVAIHWSGRGVVTKILNYLYKDAHVYMKRKYDKYISMSNSAE